MTSTTTVIVAFTVFAGTATIAGCETSKPKGSAVSASAASAIAPPAPIAPKLPPYVGKYEGKYASELFRIEMTKAEGAVKDWEMDDGKSLSGEGSIILEIGESRVITGGSSGPLGELLASGELDQDRIRVALRPKSPMAASSSVNATFVGKLEGTTISGTLRASSGDSLKARFAKVNLAKDTTLPSTASTRKAQ